MATILPFPRVAPTPFAARRARIIAEMHAQRELQIATTVARTDREIARLLSIDHLNRVQRLFATAPNPRAVR